LSFVFQVLPENHFDRHHVRLVKGSFQRATVLPLHQLFGAYHRVRKPIRFRLPERLGKWSDEVSVAVRVAERGDANIGLGFVARVEVVFFWKPEIWELKLSL
jgi:hypothetical protein